MRQNHQSAINLRANASMKKFILIVLLCPWLFIQASPSSAQSYPSYTSVYVNDFANILDAERESRLTQMLTSTRESRGVEITLVTINSQSEYGFPKDIEGFATGLFNKWGIGDAARNDGILILVAVQDRQMRIELGRGYPRRFDNEAQTIIDNYFLPAFKQGNYASGIEAGTRETIQKISLNIQREELGIIASIYDSGKSLVQDWAPSGVWPWIAGLISSFFGFVGINRYKRNKPRNCQICNREMQRLGEGTDDHYLNHGQQVEEKVLSKDYDVWHCIVDNSIIIEGYRNWFTRYKVCKYCNFRTLHVERTVIDAATEHSTGTAKIDYNCKNCKRHWFENVTIPKISRDHSSSSSSSSFSGGSSSGGGASGSW